MKITSLAENTSRKGLPAAHGLSLHIRLDDGRQILFDMGQRTLFAENAARLDIDLAETDLAVVSHGHYDHGGGLRAFLRLNHKARIYLSLHAFEPHYSLREEGMKYIGLDPELADCGRLAFCGESTRIDKDIMLFSGVKGADMYPPGNRLLYGPAPTTHDDFRHEQSLIVTEGDRTILFAGCAHAGILNIMREARLKAGRKLTHVFAGMHLVKNGLSQAQETAFIHTLGHKLLETGNCRYFTMHCTGWPQYETLKEIMGETISYMSCGDVVTL